MHHEPDARKRPPRPIETQLGYERVDKLLADDAQARAIIRKVICFDFYAFRPAQPAGRCAKRKKLSGSSP